MLDAEFEALCKLAREKIGSKHLPATVPKAASGYDTSLHDLKNGCHLCGKDLKARVFHYRVSFSGKGSSLTIHLLHFECHAAWQYAVITQAK